MIIDLEIPGKIVPNNTKYFINKSGKISSYKPEKVKKYKDKVNKHLALTIIEHKIKPICAPVEVWLDIHIEPPKSWNKSKRLLNIGFPASCKPDFDNCEKIVYDAISKDQWNQKFYLLDNDSLICKSHCTKQYGLENKIRLRVDIINNY